MCSLILINAALCLSAALPSLIKEVEVQMAGLAWAGRGLLEGSCCLDVGLWSSGSQPEPISMEAPACSGTNVFPFFFHSPRKGNNRTHPIIEHCRVLKNVCVKEWETLCSWVCVFVHVCVCVVLCVCVVFEWEREGEQENRKSDKRERATFLGHCKHWCVSYSFYLKPNWGEIFPSTFMFQNRC